MLLRSERCWGKQDFAVDSHSRSDANSLVWLLFDREKDIRIAKFGRFKFGLFIFRQCDSSWE
jgi:hypothetical protein